MIRHTVPFCLVLVVVAVAALGLPPNDAPEIVGFLDQEMEVVLVLRNGEATTLPVTDPLSTEWEEVATWSGTGERNTQIFLTESDVFKVSWHITSTEAGYSPYISLRIFDADDNVYPVEYASSSEAGSGETYVYAGPGRYYLNIWGGAFTSWTVSVLVSKPAPLQPPVPDWQQINMWSGTGERNTQIFLTESDVFKVSWHITSTEAGYSPYISLRIFDADDDVYPVEYASSSEAGSGETYVYAGPGRYYLNIWGGAFTSWTVSAYNPTGTAAVFRIDPSGDVFADDEIQAQGFHTCSADVAEWVSVTESVESGDVLAFDINSPESYCLTSTPCSSLVAGAVSSEPGFTLGQAGTDGCSKALLALVGIVPVKVTNEGGPIQPGDLLVSSSTPGYAMHWDGEGTCPCALVGKALEPLEEGNGLIKMLVMH